MNVLGDLSGLAATWQTQREDDQLLLSGVGIEYYGKLIKVTYDVMFSQDGWVSAIYGRRTAGSSSPSQKASTWKGKGTYYTTKTVVTNNRTTAW